MENMEVESIAGPFYERLMNGGKKEMDALLYHTGAWQPIIMSMEHSNNHDELTVTLILELLSYTIDKNRLDGDVSCFFVSMANQLLMRNTLTFDEVNNRISLIAIKQLSPNQMLNLERCMAWTKAWYDTRKERLQRDGLIN